MRGRGRCRFGRGAESVAPCLPQLRMAAEQRKSVDAERLRVTRSGQSRDPSVRPTVPGGGPSTGGSLRWRPVGRQVCRPGRGRRWRSGSSQSLRADPGDRLDAHAGLQSDGPAVPRRRQAAQPGARPRRLPRAPQETRAMGIGCAPCLDGGSRPRFRRVLGGSRGHARFARSVDENKRRLVAPESESTRFGREMSGHRSSGRLGAPKSNAGRPFRSGPLTVSSSSRPTQGAIASAGIS